MTSSILQEFFIRFGTDTKGFDKSIKNIDTSLSKIGNAFGRLQKIVSLAIGGKVVADMASFGMKMGLLSTQTNIGVRSLTALSSAFESAGSNAQTVQSVLTNIEKKLVGIGRGGSWELATMGISPYDQTTGQLKTPNEILMDASDWAYRSKSTLGDRQVRDMLMSGLGVDVAMAEMMMKGGSFIRAEQERAVKEGRTLSDEAKDSLLKLNIQLKELGGTIKYSLLDSVSTISPLFKEMAVVLKSLAISLNNALKGFVDWAKRKLGDKTFEERMESARVELARKGMIRYKPKDSLFNEPKRPEFPELFGRENNVRKTERTGLEHKNKPSIYDEQGKEVDLSGIPLLGGDAKDFMIFDEQGNVVDISQIPFKSDYSSVVNIDFKQTNNLETTGDPKEIINAVGETTERGIGLGMEATTG